MRTADWIMVLALLTGPILAVQTQKWLEELREKRNRRLWVFKRLMTTRGATVSPAHVEALNAIDLEFAGRGKANAQVRRRWREYLDQLGALSEDLKEQQGQLDAWAQRNQEHLEHLLHDMGLAVGYDFDLVQIRRGIYTPRGHATFEFETQAIRKLLIDLLAGNRTLPLDVRSLPGMAPPDSSPPPPESSLPPSQIRESGK